MTLSMQEIDHPTCSCSSSTSPTMTSSTVSSDSGTEAREDLCGIDSHPASVSSSHVERIERGDPLYSDIPEWLQEILWMTEFLNAETHASSSHEPSLEPTLAGFVRGPTLQGLRAENVMAEPYFVQKISVI